MDEFQKKKELEIMSKIKLGDESITNGFYFNINDIIFVFVFVFLFSFVFIYVLTIIYVNHQNFSNVIL